MDALQALMEWLEKAERYLTEDQPILGDLDTVNILIEQHKVSYYFGLVHTTWSISIYLVIY